MKQIPECNYYKPDGVRCGSPALRGKRLCYHHNRLRTARKTLPAGMPDPRDEQAMLWWISNSLMRHEMDADTAGKLIYSIQVGRQI